MVEIGWDLWKISGPKPLFTQDHLELVGHDLSLGGTSYPSDLVIFFNLGSEKANTSEIKRRKKKKIVLQIV